MRKPMKLRQKIWWSAAALLLIVFGVIGYYVYSLYSFADKIHADPEDSIFHVPNMTNTSTELTPPKWEGKERVNILLLGGDSRDLRPNELPRSDSVMIASLDPVTKKSYLFSILRDTYVNIPGNGMDRMNAALTKGGPNLAMKTVSDLMGIPIQYYVYTDFVGFIALVDALGGIDLEVEKDMKYSSAADGHKYDINLKKGYQHLDGTSALQYVRFRYDATSDYTRTERQRKFMKTLAEKLQSTTSLLKLPSILQSVDPYIETNLSVTQLVKLGSLGFEVKTDGMISQQIPPMELLEEKRVGGAEVIGVDPAQLKVFVKQLFGEAPTSTKAPVTGKLSQGTDSGSTSSSNSSGTSSSDGSSGSVGGSATATPKRPAPAATPKATPKAAAKPSETPKTSASSNVDSDGQKNTTGATTPEGTGLSLPANQAELTNTAPNTTGSSGEQESGASTEGIPGGAPLKTSDSTSGQQSSTPEATAQPQ